MKIAMLGAGATGGTVAVHLKLGGEQVYLVDPNKAHMDAIRENGLYCHEQDGTIHEKPVIFDGTTNDAKEVGICDVVIILTKCPFTRVAIDGHKELFDEHTTVITLQNGMGNTDILLDYFKPEQIAYGICYCGGFVLEPGHLTIWHNNECNVLFHRLAGEKNEVCTRLEKAFARGGFPVKYDDGIDKTIWIKLGVNSMCNMPCGIARIDIKALYDHDEGYALCRDIAKEVAAVACASGVEIEAKDIIANCDSVRAGESTGYPSGAQDVMYKRQTEVDFLNGAVARIGKRVGVPTPVNETVARLARIVNSTYDIQF